MPTNPGGLTYGTIAVAALLAAESANQETYAETTFAVVLAMLLYWLAYTYANFTGERLREQEPFSWARLADSGRHEVPVLIGATVPLVVVIVCWIVGLSLATAVTAGVWTAAGIIVVIEFLIGVRAELTGRELLAQTLIGAVLGLLVIALRVLLH